MDAVVDTGVHWNEASQHLRIGCIDDGIHGKLRDVALPDGQTINREEHGATENSLTHDQRSCLPGNRVDRGSVKRGDTFETALPELIS